MGPGSYEEDKMGLVIECIVVVLCVIGLLWCGIFIGREFGSFEAFVLAFLKTLESRVK